jgi:hypothetical protein
MRPPTTACGTTRSTASPVFTRPALLLSLSVLLALSFLPPSRRRPPVARPPVSSSARQTSRQAATILAAFRPARCTTPRGRRRIGHAALPALLCPRGPLPSLYYRRSWHNLGTERPTAGHGHHHDRPRGSAAERAGGPGAADGERAVHRVIAAGAALAHRRGRRTGSGAYLPAPAICAGSGVGCALLRRLPGCLSPTATSDTPPGAGDDDLVRACVGPVPALCRRRAVRQQDGARMFQRSDHARRSGPTRRSESRRGGAGAGLGDGRVCETIPAQRPILWPPLVRVIP